jgi:hypothetical protein
MHADDVGALQQLVVTDRLHAVVGHHQLLDVGIVGQHLEAERRGALGDGARDMAKGDEAQGHAHQAGKLVEHRPRLAPLALAHHLVLHHEAAPRGEDQGHGMVGHFLDEGVGAVGHRNAERGRRLDIDRVDADAGERHDLELLAGLDDLGSDARAALAVDRVGIDGRGRELVLAAFDLDDLCSDAGQCLHLERMVRARNAGARACRCHYFEFRHV